MYIVYSSRDEAIITTPENEAKTIEMYFTEGGRVLEDYDREVVNEEAVCILSKVMVDC